MTPTLAWNGYYFVTTLEQVLSKACDVESSTECTGFTFGLFMLSNERVVIVRATLTPTKVTKHDNAIYYCLYINVYSHWLRSFFYHVATTLEGQGLLIVVDSRSHSDTPYSIGLLWTSYQPDAETSAWQHTTLTRDSHPCPRRDSNPQSQQASGCRPTP